MKPEIIKALKENTSAFALMPQELQEAAKKIGGDKFQYYCNGDWLRNFTFDGNHFVYRLRPDYKPEPKFERWPIYVDTRSDMPRLYVEGLRLQLHKVTTLANFSGCETEKGVRVRVEDIAPYIRNGGKVVVVMRKD